MTNPSPLLKLFIGFPLTGELKGALKRHAGIEREFDKTEFDGTVYIGAFINESEIAPAEVEQTAKSLEKKLGEMVPELILHLPKAVIFPKVMIS